MLGQILRDLILIFWGVFIGAGIWYEKCKKERVRCYWEGVEDGRASMRDIIDNAPGFDSVRTRRNEPKK